MKRIKFELLVLVVLCIFFTMGCDAKKTVENVENSKKDIEEILKKEEFKKEEKNTETIEVNYSEAWDIDYNTQRVDVLYTVPEYGPNAESYNFDLDNIYNKGQFLGFSENQKKMIENNGFVVLKPSEYGCMKMHQSYESAEYSDLPVFITSDAILNMYHIFYSESMKYMELSSYHKELISLCESLVNKSLLLYDNADEPIKNDLEIVTAYFAVGAKLLNIETQLPEEIEKIVDEEIEKIMDAQGTQESLVFGTDVDYSQYTVRGHYTMSEESSQYFRSMMWFGQSGFPLSEVNDHKETLDYGNLSKSLMLTTILLDNDSKDLESWIKIFDLTSLYSGYSDDLNILDFVTLIKTVYGKSPSLNLFKDESYNENLKEAISKMRNPKINAKIENKDINMPTGKQFRLMGQRYTLDADILQNLMKPIKRPLPTAFDVLSAFGHDKAEDILYEYYTTNQQWENYDKTLAKMKDKVNDFNEEDFKSNLYHGWLWAIDAAATSFESDSNMPPFMQNQAWSHKSISSALGSYTELKHDNILYAKQAVAEMGGEFNEPEEYHYVEPNVDLYSRLLWLIKYTKANLEANGEIKEDVIEPLDKMDEMLQVLLTCSIKELENEALTSEELHTLSGIGGLIDYIDYTYLNMLRDVNSDIEDEDTTALIADVSTNLDGYYLEEAIGMPYDIYVLCKINNKLFLTRGSVYSYYEFTSTERLTNEKWHNMIGLEKEEIDEDFHITTYVGEKQDILKMMPWMSSYISPEPNNVHVKTKEIDWNSTNE